jgi:hypothetical protein
MEGQHIAELRARLDTIERLLAQLSAELKGIRETLHAAAPQARKTLRTEPLDRLGFVGLGVWSFESLGPVALLFPFDLGSDALSPGSSLGASVRWYRSAP